MKAPDNGITGDNEFALNALIASAAAQPPALEDDPTARLLGLMADDSLKLNTAELTRLRKNARLDVGQLAKALQARGWRVSSNQIARWEMKGGSEAVPAMVAAMASVLHVDQNSLFKTGDHSRFAELRSSAKFGELVDRVATLRHLSAAAAAALLETRAAAAVHRGDAPAVNQTLQALEHLVEALEQRDK